MNKSMKKLGPALLTLALVVVALFVLVHLWHYYMDDPWTRDAHVSADVVQVAPDVSGLVEQVQVQDNQTVEKGQVLFVVDRARYQMALQQAEAAHLQAEASLQQAKASVSARNADLNQLQRESARDRKLSDLVAAEDAESRRAKVQTAQAALQAAQASVQAGEAALKASQAAIDQAKLNLDRTEVKAPVSGRINDRTVRVGDYVATGKPVIAVLDTQSFRVDGYFEETRLRGVRPGQPVDIHLMGESQQLHGHVHSLAAGIEDRYRTQGSNLLPNVTPAFDWVRLAQRIPVRITLDDVPADISLIAGRTATVSIRTDGDNSQQATAAKPQAGATDAGAAQ